MRYFCLRQIQLLFGCGAAMQLKAKIHLCAPKPRHQSPTAPKRHANEWEHRRFKSLEKHLHFEQRVRSPAKGSSVVPLLLWTMLYLTMSE